MPKPPVLRFIIGGVIGAIVGALLWALVVLGSGYEVGWFAWGIGALTGAGVAIIGYEFLDNGTGVLAGFLAIVAVILAKTMLWNFIVSEVTDELTADHILEQAAIAEIAQELWAESDEFDDWVPPDINFEEEIDSISDIGDIDVSRVYPPPIWQQAKNQWILLPAAQREAKIEFFRQQIEGLGELLDEEGHTGLWSPFDGLWILLAAATAFKIGSTGLPWVIQIPGITVHMRPPGKRPPGYDEVACPSCGEPVKKDVNRCPACGRSMVQTSRHTVGSG